MRAVDNLANPHGGYVPMRYIHRIFLKGSEKFIAIDPPDYEEQLSAINELFGSTGKNIYIRPNFNCDNGKSIHVRRDSSRVVYLNRNECK